MAYYPNLKNYLATVSLNSPNGFYKNVVPYLVDVWIDDYCRTTKNTEIIETSTAEFTVEFFYLFDVATERLIAAWGISRGRNSEARDKTRMAGHPLCAGGLHHRGHAIPHSAHGGTDINLVDQLGKINVGPFRPLERKAVATEGSLYFTYWTYVGARLAKDGGPGQIPTGVDQGLLVPGQPPNIVRHGN